MKVYQLLENDWEGDHINDSNSALEDYERKFKGLYHEYDLIVSVVGHLPMQNFPVDDSEDMVPPEVWQNPKKYMGIDMKSQNGSITRVFVDKNNPTEIGRIRKALSKLEQLDHEIDETKKQINAKMRAGWARRLAHWNT